MGEAERDPQKVHNPHLWDFDSWFEAWEMSDESTPLRCSRCGFEPRAIGADMPPDCVCAINLLDSYDDPSDHSPECPYFAGPSCPAYPPIPV